ncbi:DUF885 domain-containing protein [Streptantibioticus rubrisoli]|uniref:DUF885 domain-containing protein n=1 Tax=Streptantibioticus rubrisoli TaxID=1387313 RepID=A0ABT1P836_9ACTN|nr:DUF885 domain-containing protein [Streptantibioticus rubrisoli]MCQ4040563.1 DUF885 domain-containing protein [Streptantibioticus rubrisoli]
MSDTSDAAKSRPDRRLPRAIADAYVDALAELDPLTGLYLGLNPGDDRLPDFSPAGFDALADLSRRTLAELDAAEAAGGCQDEAERRCARLLRERLTAGLAVHDAGERLRWISNLSSPVHAVREGFTLMPTETEADWTSVAGRLRNVPEALSGYRASLEEGLRQGLPGGPRQVETVVEQLTEWAGDERSWFADLVATGPQALRTELDASAAKATAAVAELRDWLRDTYAPAIRDTPDPVGRDRYALWVREWTGADLDLDEAYAWGWQEFHRIHDEMRAEAEKVLPGSTPREALAHLETAGEAVEGVEAVREWLQGLMDEAIAALDGTHFDLAEPVRKVEAMIAPPGSAAAPYYTSPALDFSRPGRTWLPTLGRERFPVYDLVSTWYHEGVPGHHLQLAQWVHVAPQLSRYQASVGLVSANVEGWALYAERLMDELGFLTDPGRRLGYLDAQMMRAVRVIIDIGMHLELPIPADSARRIGWSNGDGQRWTPALAREFFGLHSGRPAKFLDSELVRYLGMPGQAIGYKLGERAWLTGREAARRAHGADFDAKSWHMAALSQGSLGLDDLVDELSQL